MNQDTFAKFIFAGIVSFFLWIVKSGQSLFVSILHSKEGSRGYISYVYIHQISSNMALQLSGHWMLAEQHFLGVKCLLLSRKIKPIEALSMINLIQSMHLWVVKRYIPHLHMELPGVHPANLMIKL